MAQPQSTPYHFFTCGTSAHLSFRSPLIFTQTTSHYSCQPRALGARKSRTLSPDVQAPSVPPLPCRLSLPGSSGPWWSQPHPRRSVEKPARSLSLLPPWVSCAPPKLPVGPPQQHGTTSRPVARSCIDIEEWFRAFVRPVLCITHTISTLDFGVCGW